MIAIGLIVFLSAAIPTLAVWAISKSIDNALDDWADTFGCVDYAEFQPFHSATSITESEHDHA